MPVRRFQYRWIEGKRRGRWFAEQASAEHDAVRRGAAIYDPERDQVFLNVLTQIEDRPAPSL